MRPRLRGTGVWLGFCGSLVLAIAAVGCGDTIPPTAEPGGGKGPEILRAKTVPNSVAQGASIMNPTAPITGMQTPTSGCVDGASCAVVDAICVIVASAQTCQCVRAVLGDPSPTWFCD